MAEQLSLFQTVAEIYAESSDGEIDNATLYQEVADRLDMPKQEFMKKEPIGKSGQKHSILARQARWVQQTLKVKGLLERVDGKRGVWQLTNKGKQKLTRINRGYSLLAFSTKLGVAIWGNCQDIFANLGEPITLCVTSPPYPLAKARAYGNPAESEYVDFICQTLEPIVKNLKEGGSIVLNLSNDIFEKGSPARSLYRERLVIALHDRLGLSKMDELIWYSRSKPPGPVQWASLKRFQLNTGYEPLLWLTNNPLAIDSDNRRVLEPHSEKHLRLIEQGGEKRDRSYADGAYKIKVGAFSNRTKGKIPRNVLEFGHMCADQKAYKEAARNLGLPAHGAPFPLRLADFFIRFLSSEDDLVVDPFGGSMTTAKAAENQKRRWISAENILEYIRGGAERFRENDGFWINKELDRLCFAA